MTVIAASHQLKLVASRNLNRHNSQLIMTFLTPPSATSKAPPSRRSGYPLSALFVLITVIAILAAMLSPLVRGPIEIGMLLAVTIATGLIGMVLGAIIGAFYRPWWFAAPLGAASGAMLGVLIGPLTQISVVGFPTLVIACAGGAVAIVLVGVIVRLAERKRKLPLVASHSDKTLGGPSNLE
jgi:hypothetical protein